MDLNLHGLLRGNMGVKPIATVCTNVAQIKIRHKDKEVDTNKIMEQDSVENINNYKKKHHLYIHSRVRGLFEVYLENKNDNINIGNCHNEFKSCKICL